jgi:hypothetical protein
MKKFLDDGVRILVGVLFVFSGLIKVNDPYGTAIKLEEYFELFAQDFAAFFHYFAPHALVFSVLFSVMEVVLGIALLIKFRMVLTVWFLLLLILFFSFLTFYSAYFDKVNDCGCFGDAIPLTPWQSFGKDAVLMVLVGYLFVRRKAFSPLVSARFADLVTGISALVLIGMAWYSIEHLPYIDFRPYKKGANISANMQPGEPLRYAYIMEKNGKTERLEQYPSDTSYRFIEMILLNPDAQPKITDYSVWNDEGDFTEASFEGVKLMIVFHDVEKARLKNLPRVQELMADAADRYEVWVLTSNDEATYENFRHEYQVAAPYFYADGEVLKAMIRANPGIVLMRDGTVLGKWHSNDTPSAEELFRLLDR